MFWEENLQLIMNFEDFDQAYEWFAPRHEPMPFPEMTKAQLRQVAKLFKEDQAPRIAYVAEYLSSTSGKDFPTLGDLEQLLRLGRKSMDRTGPEFDDISGTFFSLANDFAFCLCAFLQKYRDDVDWVASKTSKKSGAYNRPLIARPNYETSKGYIDGLQFFLNSLRSSVRREETVDDVMDELKFAIKRNFDIDLS